MSCYCGYEQGGLCSWCENQRARNKRARERNEALIDERNYSDANRVPFDHAAFERETQATLRRWDEQRQRDTAEYNAREKLREEQRNREIVTHDLVLTYLWTRIHRADQDIGQIKGTHEDSNQCYAFSMGYLRIGASSKRTRLFADAEARRNVGKERRL